MALRCETRAGERQGERGGIERTALSISCPISPVTFDLPQELVRFRGNRLSAAALNAMMEGSLHGS
jgi:hypothetical protein